MPTELDRARIDAVVQAVADRLTGDWLLVGGALVTLWLEPRRVTEDVDIIGIEGSGADRFALLGLAGELGLPVEALNSAADFFVHRIADWREQIEPFRQGKSARIFRPSATLFLLLKIRRLSDQDLDDCLRLITYAETNKVSVDWSRIAAALQTLPTVSEPAILARRARLGRGLGLPSS